MNEERGKGLDYCLKDELSDNFSKVLNYNGS